ncbi:MAG TPA: N-acetylmuramidase domain-containing protein [Sphingomicrobium sp.]|nr:N-acetylmuramidase domain-containing protein [Sphingomicrobium sp.]
MEDIFTGRGTPLGQAGFNAAAAMIGGDVASLWSLLKVETRGFGYLADRRPKILFERHVFRARTAARFDRTAPDLSAPTPGGYIGGPAEYLRLKRAMLLDRQAALESASWGLGQVMGFNAAKIGFDDVDAMIAAFVGSEDAQLAGCTQFINASPALLAAYQNRQWARVAFFYNGRDYAKNAYDLKLSQAHADFLANGCPTVPIREVQAYLTYLGFDPRGIDGKVGSGTRAALQAFVAASPTIKNLPNLNGPADAFLPFLKDAFDQRFPS